jgi:DNA-binding SARP family transcriptional activator
MLQIGLLGSFRILLDGARVHCELGRSGRNMAGFLFAFSARAHRRERLAELCWPELDPERSRAALNSAMWRLRKAIGCEPASNGGLNIRNIGSEIVVEPASWLEIDTQLFEKNVRHLLESHASLLNASLREGLCGALDRYEGPFLEGEDAEWILEERERLHSMFVRAAMSLVKYYGYAALYEDGIALARRILVYDPYRESAIRNLLALLSLNDQRAEALQVYDRWTTSLKRELGVEPMPATVQLANELRLCDSAKQFETIKDRLFCTPSSNASDPRVGAQRINRH